MKKMQEIQPMIKELRDKYKNDRQKMNEELMAMLRETIGIIRNLDHAPTADEKRQLAEMMDRLDILLQHQQQAMQDIRDQLDIIRQQQDDFMDRQRILKQEQTVP